MKKFITFFLLVSVLLATGTVSYAKVFDTGKSPPGIEVQKLSPVIFVYDVSQPAIADVDVGVYHPVNKLHNECARKRSPVNRQL